METIDRVKQMIANGVLKQEDAEKYFPELKESDDETIRKDILTAVKEAEGSLYVIMTPQKQKRWIDWLEKQGKQMSDKIEPKFKVGDTIQTKQGQLKFVIGRIDNEYYRRKGNNAPMLRISDQDNWELVERNSAWSEEDITHYNRIIEELSIQKEKPINASYVELINSDIDWLKSLKDRVGCEMNCTTTKEWSEEDENRFNNLCWLIDKSDENEPTKNGFKNWLKERVLPQQPKQEWSKEDKYNHDIILYLLNNECVGVADKRIAIEWFKSLKEKYTWKPSGEQMNALHDAAVYVDKSMFPYPKEILMKLYKQLKKLREE